MLKSVDSRFESIRAILDFFADLPNLAADYRKEMESVKAAYQGDLAQLDERLAKGLEDLAKRLKAAKDDMQDDLNASQAAHDSEVDRRARELVALDNKVIGLKAALQQARDTYTAEKEQMTSEIADLRAQKDAALKDYNVTIQQKQAALDEINQAIANLAAK